MANKGHPFERGISKELSLWWTGGERDDVFWRVLGSGGRAKTRFRQGKDTYGTHGDIQAVDPIGAPLLEVVTLELKNGYGKWSFLDVLDRPPMRKGQKNRALQNFEKFMLQVQEDAEAANTHPVLVCKRDMRQKFIVMPLRLYAEIQTAYGEYMWFTIAIEAIDTIKQPMIAMNFSNFLEWCSPDFFKRYKKQRRTR